MLCRRLRDSSLLDDPCYIAEPKLDGQRAQLHIERDRAVACYSRPGRELLGLPGLRWLAAIRWPVRAAVLDGELCSGIGLDGVDGILTACQQDGGDASFMVFDLCQLGGHDVMAEPWVDRRQRLEDVFTVGAGERVQLVPAFADARRLWTVWVIDWGGEGIVLKDRRSTYEPGARARSWWKAERKLVLSVEVLRCADRLVPWGDWGQACVMAFEYRDPRTAELVTVEQAVRVPGATGWTGRPGPAEIVCWGMGRSRLLRDPQLLRVGPAPEGGSRGGQEHPQGRGAALATRRLTLMRG
jgi:ATP-dependent DNA ligase